MPEKFPGEIRWFPGGEPDPTFKRVLGYHTPHWQGSFGDLAALPWYTLGVDPHPHKVAICFDKAEDGRIVCVGLLIDPRTNLEVSSRFLRDLHLGLANAAAADSQSSFLPVDLVGKSTSRRARPGPKGWDAGHFRRVAEMYEGILGSETPRGPVKQLAEKWPCSEATAHRWLQRARELGLLPPISREQPTRSRRRRPQ